MRDLIRNYKRILSGKNRDSESEDEESQPICSSSSSYSSTPSFGTVKQNGLFTQESCTEFSEDENDNRPEKNDISSISRLKMKKYLNRHLFMPNENVEKFNSSDNIYDNLGRFNKIDRNFKDDLNSLSIQSDIFKSPSSSDSYDSYPIILDYRDEPEKTTHNSIVTIFAIWNTTMGSSLLAMSWGLEKSGLFPGIFINIMVAAICLYTGYLLLSVNDKHGMPGQHIEVPDLCRMLLGKWSEILAKIFSIIVLLGANIVYWILMSNFLYNSVRFLYSILTSKETDIFENTTVICPKEIFLNLNDSNIRIFNQNEIIETNFEKIWNLYSTVPIFLGLIMFPILNFKSPTFFTKFNSLGTISVGYLLIFVCIKGYIWGINLPNINLEFNIKSTFCALSGMLSLSYFIHNIIISIMRHNKNPENNTRDLSIAFGLITFTYIFIGVVFYICFPLAKSCIEDNILNNFNKSDTLTIIARILLMFQLFTVFPLIAFMLRSDILKNVNYLFKNYRFGDFTYGRTIFLNIIVLFICIMFACFLPRIGTLIRYTGALSGLVYIFMLPSLLKMASLKKEKQLTFVKIIFYCTIIIVGGLNLFSQFFISDN